MRCQFLERRKEKNVNMNRNGRTRKWTAAFMLIVMLLTAVTVTGCSGGRSKWAGNYIGYRGSSLVLKKDGTGLIFNTNDTYDLTWKIADGCLHIYCDCHVHLYADISGTKPEEGFLLCKAEDGYSWRDEMFYPVGS